MTMSDAKPLTGKFWFDGRNFEIAKQADGTWWLLLWPSPATSIRIGVHAMAEAAKYQAENLPKDFDVRAAVQSPGGFQFGESIKEP